MNKYKKKLKKELKEYKKTGNMNKYHPMYLEDNYEIWKNTKEAKYVYKKFPLFYDKDVSNKEILHTLMPKEDYEAWNNEFDEEGIPIIQNKDETTKRLYVCCKERL